MKYIEMLMASMGVIYCLVFGDFSLIEKKGYSSENIYYDNVQYTDNIDFYGIDGLTLQYAGQLSVPGDFYELSFDIINAGSVDVEIAKCVFQDSDPYIEYQLTYDDGKHINIGDMLKSGEKRRVKYRVLYKNRIDNDSYEFDSSFYLSYEQSL